MGFRTNGGIAICQKNDGFDSNGVLDLIRKREKKRWVLKQRWNSNLPKKDGFDSNGALDLLGEREKKDGFWMNGGLEFNLKKKMGFRVMVMMRK